jgi:aminomethyltransferase
VIANVAPAAKALTFMMFSSFESRGFGQVVISRSGYTGEDGFEILVKPEHAEALAKMLLAHADVRPIGLGARDSLRLEAGLHLYGHDMDPARSPVEAGLAWTIQKARRERADFPGAARILSELKDGTAQKRIGLKLKDKAPAREGAQVALPSGEIVGVVTSGGFGPTVGGPIAMAYVASAHGAPGTALTILVRGQPRAAEVVTLPFVPHRYVRKGA